MIVGKVEIKLRFKMTKLLYAEFSITGGMISNDILVGFKVYSAINKVFYHFELKQDQLR